MTSYRNSLKNKKVFFYRYFGLLLWFLKVLYETRTHTHTKSQFFQLFVVLSTSLNLIYIIYCLDNELGIPKVSQSLCWILSCFAFVSPIFSPMNIRQRICAIENGLVVIFTLMSLSYEPLFFMAFATNLKYWIEYEFNLHQEGKKERLDDLTFALEKSLFQSRFVNLGDVRRVTKFVSFDFFDNFLSILEKKHIFFFNFSK